MKKFDRDEIEHGFDLIRELIDGAQELTTTGDKEEGKKIVQGQFREQLATYLSYLIQGEIPEGRWPSPLAMSLMIPQLGEGEGEDQDNALLHFGYELMVLYDSAVLDGEWLAFDLKLDEFKKAVMDNIH
jgi:hypothetical protein